MQRLCFYFNCGKCSCIFSKKEEQDIKKKKSTLPTFVHKNIVEAITTCSETCAKMANIDIHSNAQFFASSSSIKTTPIAEPQSTLEDIRIAYQKLQSLISDPLVKLAIPKCSNTKCSSSLHQPPRNISTLGSYDKQCSLGSYYTPNKIAYKGLSSTGSNTPTISNLNDGSSKATLQDLIQKLSINKTPPMTQECSLADDSTERLMSKLKNLDEILKNLDNSLLYQQHSIKLFAPQNDKNHSNSSMKSSNKSFVTSKPMPSKNIRLLSTNGELTFATPPHPAAMMHKLELNERNLEHLRGERTLALDKSYSVSRSSESTQIPQSFATPITTRETQDVPLLLSKFANYNNGTQNKIWNEEKTMKEVVEMIVEQVGQRVRFLQRGPWRRQQKRCKMVPSKQPTNKFWKQFLSDFQQRLARTDATLEIVKRQLDQVLKDTNYKSDTNSMERESRIAQGTTQAIESIKDSASLRRIVKTLEEKYSTLSTANHQFCGRIEGIEKQCREHSTELELCWAAINQLCIDNEVFRNELLQQQDLNEKK